MLSDLLASGRPSRSAMLIAALAAFHATAACSDAPVAPITGANTSSSGGGAFSEGSLAGAGVANGAGSGSGGSPSAGHEVGGGLSGGALNTSGGSGVAGTGSSAAGSVAVAGGGSAGSAGSTSGLPNPLGAPAAFIEKCATCHGVDAKGTALGPEVEHAPAPLLAYYVRNGDDNTWQGCDVNQPNSTRPCSSWGDQRVMTAFPASEVSDADMSAITAWLDALPKPTTGAALYADYCSGCHGPGGDIPPLTYYVKNSSPVQSADLAKLQTTVKDGLTANRLLDERSRYMPPFGSLLSDAEIILIARWMCTQTFSVTPPFCAQL